MFTGLVQKIGTIVNVHENNSGKEFKISCPDLRPEISVDDSVSINGVCLTATRLTDDGFFAQAVAVTLEKTNLDQLQKNEKVNLELAMKYSDRVGGHFVQGHVSGTTTLVKNISRGENHELWFIIPDDLQKFLFKEGSIAIDGISLTIADIKDDKFMVSIIPHTWSVTQIHQRMIGDLVNIEVDMMAKMMANYIEKYFKNDKRETHVTV